MFKYPAKAAALVVVQRQALHHDAFAELLAKLVDGQFGAGGAAVDQIGQVAACGLLEMADANADQAKAGAINFILQEVPAGRENARGKLVGMTE